MTGHDRDPYSLINKYFIIPPDSPHATMHGQILAPVGDNEMIYLCELQPVDAGAVFVLPTQTILTVEHLIGAYLYDDETIWQEQWRQVAQEMVEAKAKAAAAREANQAKLIAAVRAGQVTVVGVNAGSGDAAGDEATGVVIDEEADA